MAEILAHLSDVELVVGYRLRMILNKNGTPIQAFDQDDWARTGNYIRQPVERSLGEFRILRGKNLALLRAIPKAAWKKFGRHEERGKETLARFARMIAGHDINHLGQIARIARQFRRG